MIISENSVMSNYSARASQNNKNFDALTQMFMTALDTNKNGTIDKTEFSNAAKTLAKNESSTNVDNAFIQIDTNGDSQLSSDEFLSALKEADQKRQQYRQQTDMNALDSTLLSERTNKLTQVSVAENEAQKTLHNKIMLAYSNQTISTGKTTNISV
jgi:hypothetical protein